jgi:hypothetical protein
MMSRPTTRLIKVAAAAMFLLIAGIVAWRSLRVPGPARVIQQIERESDDAAILREVAFAPVDELGGPASFAATIKGAIEREAREKGLSAAQAQSLASYASERFRMLLADDYDAYAADLQRLFGRPASSMDIDFMADRERWLVYSGKFSSSSVSPDAIFVRRWVDDGSNPRGSTDGAYAYISTPEPYKNLLGRARSVDICDVYVPAQVQEVEVPQIGSGGRALDCFVIFSFAWDAQRARWIPWRSGVYEPAGVGKVLPNPWI